MTYAGKNLGAGVGASFTLPWNTTRTMANVWELSPVDVNVERFRYHVTPRGDQPNERLLPVAREIQYVEVLVK